MFKLDVIGLYNCNISYLNVSKLYANRLISNKSYFNPFNQELKKMLIFTLKNIVFNNIILFSTIWIILKTFNPGFVIIFFNNVLAYFCVW